MKEGKIVSGLYRCVWVKTPLNVSSSRVSVANTFYSLVPFCGRLFSLEKPSLLGTAGSVVVSSAKFLNMQQLQQRAATIPPMVSPHSLYPHLAFRYAPLDRDRAQPPRHVSPASISTSADHALWFASADTWGAYETVIKTQVWNTILHALNII